MKCKNDENCRVNDRKGESSFLINCSAIGMRGYNNEHLSEVLKVLIIFFYTKNKKITNQHGE